MSIGVLHNGTSHHLACYKDYKSKFDDFIYTPQINEQEAMRHNILVVSCWGCAILLANKKEFFKSYLNNGGFLIIMGMNPASLCVEGISQYDIDVNFWWWLEDPDKPPLKAYMPNHEIFKYIPIENMWWHYHSYFEVSNGIDIVVSDRNDKCVLFDDKQSYNGRLMAMGLDPHFHHGHKFMPNTTKFLNGFYDWINDLDNK